MTKLQIPAALAATVTLALPALAQQPEAPTKHHKMLQKAVGHWEGTLTSFDPSAPPTPMPAKETITAFGPFWIRTEFECDYMGQKYEGIGYSGYDPKTEQYVGSWVDNMSSHFAKMTGKRTADGHLEMRWMSPGMDGKMLPHRYVMKYADDHNSYVTTFFIGDGEGEKSMTIEMSRKGMAAKPAGERAPKTSAAELEEITSGKQMLKRFPLGMRLEGTTALKDIDGKVHRADEYRGSITVVNFWSTKCPIMQAYEDRMTKIMSHYGPQGVEFVMINSNDANGELADADASYQHIRDYLQSKNLERTVLVDPGSMVANALGAKTTPDIFVFNESGKLIYRGLIDDDPRNQKGDKARHYLREALDAALEEERVEVPETEPHGCSIKRAR